MYSLDDEDYEIKTIKKPPRNAVRELRKDLQVMIDKDPCVLDDVKFYKEITGLDIDKLNKMQLEELLMFCSSNYNCRNKHSEDDE